MKNSTTLPVFLASLVIASVLLSGQAVVNFSHTTFADKMIKDNKVVCTNHLLASNVCHIYLSSELKEQENFVDVINKLDTATRRDTIIIHLAGVGGQVDTTVAIINAMQRSKATVITSVDGSVASGHAYIALASKHITVAKDGVFMMHHTSALHQENMCNKYEGQQDRGQDMKAKCLHYIESSVKSTEEVLNRYVKKFLTEEEFARVLAGDDVYLSLEELQKRVDKVL